MTVEYKLESFQEELDNDVVIDATKLQYEVQNNVVIYSKWARMHSNCRKEMLKLEAQKKTAMKKRQDYYTGRSEPGEEVCMDSYEKSEMKTVLAADTSVLGIETKYQYWGILLEFCSDAMDAIKARGFSLKTMLDIRKFEAGEK